MNSKLASLLCCLIMLVSFSALVGCASFTSCVTLVQPEKLTSMIRQQSR